MENQGLALADCISRENSLELELSCINKVNLVFHTDVAARILQRLVKFLLCISDAKRKQKEGEWKSKGNERRKENAN